MNNKQKILDIAMNLSRIGNWIFEDSVSKKKRIDVFLKNTDAILNSLPPTSFTQPFRRTYEIFLNDYQILTRQIGSPSLDNKYWGEKIMTWGTILTHRSKLI